jgi:hypothetical protein
MSDTLSIGKAAKLLGVCPETLRNWDRNGLLKPVKTVGGHRRYRLEDIQNLLGSRMRNKEKITEYWIKTGLSAVFGEENIDKGVMALESQRLLNESGINDFHKAFMRISIPLVCRVLPMINFEVQSESKSTSIIRTGVMCLDHHLSSIENLDAEVLECTKIAAAIIKWNSEQNLDKPLRFVGFSVKHDEIVIHVF